MNKIKELKKNKFEINKFGEKQYLFDFLEEVAIRNKEKEELLKFDIVDSSAPMQFLEIDR